jgi:hypothetical protein
MKKSIDGLPKYIKCGGVKIPILISYDCDREKYCIAYNKFGYNLVFPIGGICGDLDECIERMSNYLEESLEYRMDVDIDNCIRCMNDKKSKGND